jgi:signal transduction histidine kinase/ligand-binding sensor domain-containing protein
MSRHGTRLALVILLASAHALPSKAFTPSQSEPIGDYTIASWGERDGVPPGRIRVIRQDSDGYLWLATDAGLIRFDGARFDEWRGIAGSRLPAGAATALLIAHDRSLWVGFSGSSPIARIRNGAFTLYGAGEGLAGRYVLSLTEDRSGTIWAATFQGLFQFRGERWLPVGLADGLGEGPVLGTYEDREGQLWVATQSAVFRKAAGGGRFEQVDVIGISSNLWQNFSEDAAGTVWMTDFNEGYRVPGRHSAGGDKPPRHGFGVQLLHDRRGNLWVATQGQGLWRVREGAGRGTVQAAMIADGLQSDSVQALFEDREGNLWLSTRDGLQRLSPRQVRPIKNLPIGNTIAVTPDGSTWVGTAGGLTQFSMTGRRDYSQSDGLPGSVVMALQAGDGDDLWVSTERGVAHFARGRFSPVLIPPGDGSHRVTGMAAAGGTLWLRDFHSRLFQSNGGPMTVPGTVPDLFRKGVTTLSADRAGNVWIAAGGRMGVLESNGRFRSYALSIGSIACIFEDASGTLWAGGDEGLGLLSGDRFIPIRHDHGFPANVRTIVEDDLGFLWIGAATGILRVDRRELVEASTNPAHQVRYRLFNAADGVAGAPMGEGRRASVRSSTGKLWFLTTSGVTVVDPHHLGESRPMPPVRIETVTADSHTLDPTPDLRLGPRTSHVQIAFSVLTLTDPARVHFRYRLDEYDRDWLDVGAARQASYTNLPPGRYRFRVLANGGDGVWRDPGAVWDFNVEPFFYQTRWFRALCILAISLLVYASWRVHVRQVRRQFALVLAERIRMSRAIHDTLLQRLAGLALQVDDLSHMVETSPHAARERTLRIRRQVEDSIREARQSIWDLRSPKLVSHDLPKALREAGERVIAGRPVKLDVRVSGAARRAGSRADEQLLLIGQEALSNAVRHGRATAVTVELDYGDDQTRLSVRDDGCGFDPGEACRLQGHYGLVSMRERAEQLRGRIVISSVPGEGTAVEAVVPA